MVAEGRVLAGPHPFDPFFKHFCPDHVGDGYRTNKDQAPPKAFFAIINSDENQEEKVKRRPEQRIPEIREKSVEEGVGPLTVELHEKPFVPLVEALP